MRLLALLLFPLSAWADPVSITAALASAWAAVSTITVVQALAIVSIGTSVFGAAQQRRKARKLAAQQKAKYNAGLEDRSVTLLQANPPQRVVYGRCIVGGDIVAMFTTDKVGVREDGSTYTKQDALKHLVIVVAAHEVQAINDVLIDGVSIGPLDGSGWVTSGDFYDVNKPAMRTATIGGAGYVDVSPPVVSLLGSYTISGAGVDAIYSPFTPTLSIGNTRISGPIGGTVNYTVSTNVAAVRVSTHTGTSAQTVDTYLNSVAPSQWTSNHRLRGLAYAVVTLDLEEPRFQAGPPQITFDVSGKKVLDTRTSTTAYSENPALITRDFLVSAYGLGVGASEIDTAACNAAANACDARLLAAVHAHATTFSANATTNEITCAADRWFSTGDGVRLTTTGTLPAGLSLATTYYIIATASRTAFKLATSAANAFAGTAMDITGAGSGTHTVTWYDYAAYTCNGAVATDGSGKEAVLEDLVETMGGTATYGATWIIQAGAWVAPVMSLTDDDLDGQIEIVQAGAGLDAIFNGVRGQYIPAGKATPVDMQPYSNATFVTADGGELWTDVSLPFVGNKVRAANLARIMVERVRDGLVIRYPAKLKAWPLQIGDRVAVTSAEYGWSAKTFRVTDWQFSAETAVILTLQEDAAAIYDLADAVSVDPAPNTGLPSPWAVAAVTGVSAASGTTHLLRTADGKIITRVYVSWSPVTDYYVNTSGGYVYVAWKPAGGAWTTERTTGDDTNVYINNAHDGQPITIAVWAENSLGAKGKKTYISHTVLGKAQAPQNVASLTYSLVTGAVRIKWTAATDLDYKATHLRIGASWAGGTNLAGDAGSTVVVGSQYDWRWPAAGTYTLRARHCDTTGNLSATEATLSITVTAGGMGIREIRDADGNLLIDGRGLSPMGLNVSFFDGFDSDESIGGWQIVSGSGEVDRWYVTDLTGGSYVMRVGDYFGNDEVRQIHKVNIRFDATALYRVKASLRRPAGTGTVFVGLAGIGADGVTLVNTTGANSTANQHYIAASGADPGANVDVTYTGYVMGSAASGTGSACPDPSAPGKMHADVRYIRPIIVSNYSAQAGQVYWSYVSIERIGGAVGTNQLGPGATSAGTITDSTSVTGSSASPGVSARAYNLIGPAITTAAGDELDILVGGFHNDTFWSQAALAKVDMYIATSATYGGAITEVGQRCRYVSPVNVYTVSSGATNIPLDMSCQLVPGAVTQYYNLHVLINYVNSAGSATNCAKDFAADLQWRVVKRKR